VQQGKEPARSNVCVITLQRTREGQKKNGKIMVGIEQVWLIESGQSSRERKGSRKIMSDTGVYPTRKQKHYVEKLPNEHLVKAIFAVVPKSESIIDLGAGCGHFVKRLRVEGYRCGGVDGTPGITDLSGGTVHETDLTGKIIPEEWSWDWGLFSDVGEHVPREHEQQLIDNICRIPRKGLIISWGFPHERGYHHVNCRTQVYVACEFAKRGWWPDDELTTLARDASGFWPKHHIRLFVARRKEV